MSDETQATKTKKAVKRRKRGSKSEVTARKKMLAFYKAINNDLIKISKKMKKFIKG